MSHDDRRAQSPQSVTRVIRILEALCGRADPVGLAELSRTLDTPKSSLSALLRGLGEAGFVVAAEGTWRLGPGAFALGSALTAARGRLHSSDLVRAGMQRLAERSGETTLFAVADGDGATLTYVEIVESRNVVRFAVSVGDRRPLYCTAGGRALLAAAPEATLTAYLAGLRPIAPTPRSVTGKRRLADIIAEVRTKGVAQTVDEAADGVTGTAAAIRDSVGVIGALVVAAPSARIEHRRDAVARMVREEADIVSRSLGFMG